MPRVGLELVKRISYMFNGCTSLEVLDLSCIRGVHLDCMSNLVGNCSKLMELDISGLDIHKDEFWYYGIDLNKLKRLKVSKLSGKWIGSSNDIECEIIIKE